MKTIPLADMDTQNPLATEVTEATEFGESSAAHEPRRRIVLIMTSSMERPPGVRYFNIARELVRRGHWVRILALHHHYEGCTQRRLVQDGVEIWYMGQMHVRKQGSHVAYFGLWALLRVVLFSTLGLIWGIVRSPAHIYHLGKPQPINGLAALIGVLLLQGKRFYIDCDDDETHSNVLTPVQRKVFGFFEWLLIKVARGATVNTHFLARRNAQMGNPVTAYVPNGVDLARFGPETPLTAGLRGALNLEGCRVAAYFGSMNLRNHPVDLLLDAFALLYAESNDVRLLMIGGGPDLAKLQAQVHRLGIDSAVCFTGHIPQAALPAFLALAKLTVDPVHDDSVAKARSPLKLYESMAMGLPVVTGAVGDRAEWLEDGAAGVLVAPGSPESLARGMARLLDNPIGCAETARFARQRVARFYTWAAVTQAWVELYRRFEPGWAQAASGRPVGEDSPIAPAIVVDKNPGAATRA